MQHKIRKKNNNLLDFMILLDNFTNLTILQLYVESDS